MMNICYYLIKKEGRVMIVHTKDGKIFQVCQTDQGEQVWNEYATKLLAEGDFVQVKGGVIYCIVGARSVFSHGIEAGERE